MSLTCLFNAYSSPLHLANRVCLCLFGGLFLLQSTCLHDHHHRPPSNWPIIQATMNDHHKRMQWPSLFIGVCFAVVGVALQVFPISEPLPVTFHLLRWALELAFATLLVSVCIRHGNQAAAGILEHVGIFFGSMAFMVAITMNLPTPLMMISLAVYAISILVIIFANLFPRTL